LKGAGVAVVEVSADSVWDLGIPLHVRPNLLAVRAHSCDLAVHWRRLNEADKTNRIVDSGLGAFGPISEKEMVTAGLGKPTGDRECLEKVGLAPEVEAPYVFPDVATGENSLAHECYAIAVQSEGKLEHVQVEVSLVVKSDFWFCKSRALTGVGKGAVVHGGKRRGGGDCGGEGGDGKC